MPKEKLLKQQISFTEEKPLQSEELQQVKDKLYKQVIIYLPGYLLLLAGALIIFLNAPESYRTVVSRRVEIDEEEAGRMWRLSPYFSLFVFLMATIFFGKIFYQSILPLIKDIKHKTKILVFYKPQKTDMGVFNRYYLSTPLFTKRRIEIDANEFNKISETEDVCIEVSTSSMVILKLKANGKQIYYYTSAHS